jgi:hypothetical protein
MYRLRLKICIVCNNMYRGDENSRFCSRKCWVYYQNMPNGSVFKCLLCNTVFKVRLSKDEGRHTHFNYKKKCPKCGAKGDYIIRLNRPCFIAHSQFSEITPEEGMNRVNG